MNSSQHDLVANPPLDFGKTKPQQRSTVLGPKHTRHHTLPKHEQLCLSGRRAIPGSILSMVYIRCWDLRVEIGITKPARSALPEYIDKNWDAFNTDDEHPSRPLWEPALAEDDRGIYANPEGQDPDDHGLRPALVRKKVLVGPAKPGDKYWIRIKYGPNSPFKDYVLYTRVYIDGQWVEGFKPGSVDPEKYNATDTHTIYVHKVREWQAGGGFIPKDLEFDEPEIGE